MRDLKIAVSAFEESSKSYSSTSCCQLGGVARGGRADETMTGVEGEGIDRRSPSPLLIRDDSDSNLLKWERRFAVLSEKCRLRGNGL